MPSKAYVLSSYDTDANLHYNIKIGKTIFNPKKQIIPDGYISSLHKINIVSVTDDMTGLLNRRGFISNGIETIKNSTTHGKKGLILFGDMDGLKKINDNFGHAAGDKAIKAEAKILKNLFRSSDIIGRLGGDEFAIIAPDMNVEKFKKMKKILQEKCQK